MRDCLFDYPFPYMMCMHQGPVNGEDCSEFFHFHIEFFPPMRAADKQKFNASSETGAWACCNPTAPEEKAVEHSYIGVKCGIMDQFASAMGKENHAIYLDCNTLNYELVPLELGYCCLVLSNTNKKHSLGASKYNERRMECEAGLSALQTVLPDIKQLADVSVEQFEANKEVIKDEVVRRRVHHVVYECDRVKRSVVALKAGDLKTFGSLMNESHDSLQYDYEVTCDKLDILAAEARKLPYVIGSRMTGAGFGGCTVSVVKTAHAQDFIDTIAPIYEEKVGHAASFYITEIGDGGREIK